MMSKLIINLVAEDVCPHEIAPLVQVISGLHEHHLTGVVLCDDTRQAGQLRRRLRERLEDEGLDTAVVDAAEPGTPYVNLSLSLSEIVEEGNRAADATTVKPSADHTASPALAGEHGEASLGDFTGRLSEVQIAEYNGTRFLAIRMCVSEGPEAGKEVRDRVIARPVGARTEHLAKALGLDASLLDQEIGARVGSELRVRRKVVIRGDG